MRSYLGGLLWLATPTKLGWFLWFERGSIPMNLFWITGYVPVHVSCHWCTGQGPPPWWSTELLLCRDLCFAHLRQEHGTRWRSILDTANGRVMESKARFLRQLSLAEIWPHAVEDSLGFAVFIGFSMVSIIIIRANVISHAPSSCATSSSICGSLLGITRQEQRYNTFCQHILPPVPVLTLDISWQQCFDFQGVLMVFLLPCCLLEAVQLGQHSTPLAQSFTSHASIFDMFDMLCNCPKKWFALNDFETCAIHTNYMV